MAHNVLVNADDVVVGGADHNTGDVVLVSDAEFTALTDAGRFTGGSPVLTDQGVVANDPTDSVFAQASGPTALIAMTSAAVTPPFADLTAAATAFNALRTDVINSRTYVTGVHTALTGAGKPFSS